MTTLQVDGDLILIPVFDDWAALALLIRQLDDNLAANSRTASMVVVDDGSVQPVSGVPGPDTLRAIRSIEVVSLTRNVGHQRALAIGLSFIAASRACRAVVVMDADGEDLASDVPRLLAAFEAEGEKTAIFAQRTRRSEGIVFTLFYRLYRAAHRILTGVRVEVGNFSVMPYAIVRKLAVVSEMWNHYAAAVVHARIPFKLLPTMRGRRLAGTSRMNFLALAGHGLSAMSVFSDRIGVRMIAATGGMMLLLLLVLAVIGAIKMLTDLVIPGWTLTSVAVLGILLVQLAALATVFTLTIHGGRARSSFIPLCEYKPFIDSIERIWP